MFVRQTRILLGKLDTHAASGEPFHIYPYMTHAALDMITECATGHSVNAQADGDTAYVKAVYTQLESTFERVLKPWWWPAYYWYCSRMGRAAARSLKVLHTATRAFIRRRRVELFGSEDPAAGAAGAALGGTGTGYMAEGTGAAAVAANAARERSQSQPTGCSNFLDVLLTAKDGNGQPLSDEGIQEEVDTFIFEGHDTTSSAMTWALYLIGCFPEVLAAVQAELDEVLTAAGKDVPDFEDCKQ